MGTGGLPSSASPYPGQLGWAQGSREERGQVLSVGESQGGPGRVTLCGHQPGAEALHTQILMLGLGSTQAQEGQRVPSPHPPGVVPKSSGSHLSLRREPGRNGGM